MQSIREGLIVVDYLATIEIGEIVRDGSGCVAPVEIHVQIIAKEIHACFKSVFPQRIRIIVDNLVLRDVTANRMRLVLAQCRKAITREIEQGREDLQSRGWVGWPKKNPGPLECGNKLVHSSRAEGMRFV